MVEVGNLSGDQFGGWLTVHHGTLHVGGEPYRMAAVEENNSDNANRTFHVPMENGIVLSGVADDADHPAYKPEGRHGGHLIRAVDATNRLGVTEVFDHLDSSTTRRRTSGMRHMAVLKRPEEFHASVAAAKGLGSGTGSDPSISNEPYKAGLFPWEQKR